MEMPTYKSILTILLSFQILLTVNHSSLAQRYSLDDWMTVSSVDEFVYSKDGRSFYYTSNNTTSGTYDIFQISTDGKAEKLIGKNEPKVRPEPKVELTLSPDGKTLFFTSSRYYSAFLNIYSMPVTGGVPQAITFNDAVIQTSPSISPDGKTLAFFARTGSGAKIFSLDLEAENAWPEQMFTGDAEEFFPSWSSKGDLAYRQRGDIWIKKKNQSEPSRLIDPNVGGGNSNHVWSPGGDKVAFLNSKSGNAQIGVVDIESKKVTPITYHPVEHTMVAWSPDGEWLAFIESDSAGMSNQLVIARSDGTGQRKVLTNGKGRRFDPKFSPDGKHIAFIENNSIRTRDIWTVEISSGKKSQVTHSMGKIDPDKLSLASEIYYLAEDNLKIPGMMWLPPNFDPKKKYPVIVRLHGHPTQWNHDFRMMTQYFVQQGFVAIAPNPRGSVGFGQGFHDLHIADYAGAEYRDVMGVIPFMESLGYIDMSRKATWGGSGGGYMSMVIATKAPDVFQAQVIRAPVTNWKILMDDRFAATARAWTATRKPSRSRSDMGGSYEEAADEYELRSPTNYIDQVKVPQLLFHGLRDTNVLPRQSTFWQEKMLEHGKGDLLTFVKYPDEDHGLKRYKSTIRNRIERMTEFFSKHLDLPALK